MNSTSDGAGITVIYDGECPFCSQYVKLLRLREAAGPVRLLDARVPSDEVTKAQRLGYDLNEGMVARVGGRYYHGPDAVHMLALISTGSGLLNRTVARIFASPTRSRLLYPILRLGRNLTLRALGRRTIPDAADQSS